MAQALVTATPRLVSALGGADFTRRPLLRFVSALALCCICAAAERGEPSEPWSQILASVGFTLGADAPRILYVAPGSKASPLWQQNAERGAWLLVEGDSAVAASFGIRAGAESVRVANIVDTHNPKLPLIWEKPIDLPRFTVPENAQVFAKDRASGAPLLAGLRVGDGGVLWAAASPGEHGYERFPYILHALADLGLRPLIRSARLWAFFDYSYRTRADLDYFAARWRDAGISALHVAAWHFFEPNAERDAYLKALIAACHRKGVLVYAWIELPHVSEKFWNDNPEWREKTAVLQDAFLDWRKLMNLANPDCSRAVAAGVEDLVRRFDWDGLNLAELYFESLQGAANPSRFTPMNDSVRAEFRQVGGFDPIELFGARKDAASLRLFLDYRASLVRRIQEEWLGRLAGFRAFRTDLDLVLTHVDDRFDSGMKDAIGADAAAVLPLLDQFDFTFLIEDPATVWHLGPQRYPEIARRYQPLTSRTDRLAIDINVVDRYQDVYPTKQQTGTELFQLLHLAAGAFPRVALYFENSILAPDLPFLPAAASQVHTLRRDGNKVAVDSAHGVGLDWKGPASVNGQPWPIASNSTVWLPPGPHVVEPAATRPPLMIADFNGDLEWAEVLPDGRLRLSYHSKSRAIAILDRKPSRIEVDGKALTDVLTEGGAQWNLILPRGRHSVILNP